MPAKLPYYRFFLRRLLFHLKGSHARPSKLPNTDEFAGKTLILGVESGLLRSASLFPYFMLVALEAGGLLRGLLLLILYPLLYFLSAEVQTNVMTIVCFFGIKAKTFRVGRAVLPKFFLEDVGLEGFQVLKGAERRVCYTRMPRAMVEGFLKEYLEVETVVARELKVFCGFYTGLMEEERPGRRRFEEVEHGDVGFGGYPDSLQHNSLFSICEKVYTVSRAEKKKWQALPRANYPKPLIFHDGRLAFWPTPAATLAMVTWLPLALPLSVLRVLFFVFLPYPLAIPLAHLTGMKSRVISAPCGGGGDLFVCNHRTLLDPVYISASINRHLSVVTYSLSPLSEILSPIKTVRLTRDKPEDRRRMERLLEAGGLVVCPEGTTCREPCLLRFSPLFAEVADEVVPVALSTRVSTFYGTSTVGAAKWMDPFFFLMNPRPEYDIEFLEKVRTGGRGGVEVANYVQGEIAKVLGFECTNLTRKDKYLMLAGNVGVVVGGRKNKGQ